jgi:hypothetical protein
MFYRIGIMRTCSVMCESLCRELARSALSSLCGGRAAAKAAAVTRVRDTSRCLWTQK